MKINYPLFALQLLLIHLDLKLDCFCYSSSVKPKNSNKPKGKWQNKLCYIAILSQPIFSCLFTSQIFKINKIYMISLNMMERKNVSCNSSAFHKVKKKRKQCIIMHCCTYSLKCIIMAHASLQLCIVMMFGLMVNIL